MRRDLRRQVEVGQRVAVEHQEAFVEHVLGELQRAAGAKGSRFLQVAQPHAGGRAVAEHGAHPGGEMPAGHDDVVDAVHAQPVEHERDERPVDQGDDRLRHRGGQRPQPRPLASREDQRLHQPCPPRPIPSYTRPAARTTAGSYRLRPSTSSSPRIEAFSAARSRSANSGHSVTSTTASAPSTAPAALSEKRTPRISLRASPSATGSYARTRAPAACSREESTSEEASRMSSVFGLNASPSSAISLSTSRPRCFSSLAITRRFCSSLTSMTELSSWKW